jgi:hypothetical protein
LFWAFIPRAGAGAGAGEIFGFSGGKPPCRCAYAGYRRPRRRKTRTPADTQGKCKSGADLFQSLKETKRRAVVSPLKVKEPKEDGPLARFSFF